MAIINYTDQIKYTGKGYLDVKMMPVASVEELNKISRTQRFEGLTITVLNNGNPQDYWLIGGTANSNWVPKNSTNFNELRLTLENGFLKLLNGNNELRIKECKEGHHPRLRQEQNRAHRVTINGCPKG